MVKALASRLKGCRFNSPWIPDCLLNIWLHWTCWVTYLFVNFISKLFFTLFLPFMFNLHLPFQSYDFNPIFHYVSGDSWFLHDQQGMPVWERNPQVTQPPGRFSGHCRSYKTMHCDFGILHEVIWCWSGGTLNYQSAFFCLTGGQTLCHLGKLLLTLFVFTVIFKYMF